VNNFTESEPFSFFFGKCNTKVMALIPMHELIGYSVGITHSYPSYVIKLL